MSFIKPYKFLKKTEIEYKACEVLNKFQNERKTALSWPLDAMDIAEYLGLDFDFESIPSDDEGVIAAMIFPAKKLILINQDLESMSNQEHSGFRESTIGHEIGHWILHIDAEEVDGKTKQGELDLFSTSQNEESFLCRSLSELGDWREWQAQYFSSCLLMPCYFLEKIRHKYDLSNLSDLYKMKDEIGVTISNLKHRLRDLGWIEYDYFDAKKNECFEQSNLF